ncbi:MAG: hypothetical protein GY804_12575 [Alphaproteobacteria bacterium]|nr:hypothetical protein [Alphaproteobacteria bacterium]
MAQNSIVLESDSGLEFMANLNNALQALTTNFSGATELWGVDAFEMKQKCNDASGESYLCGKETKQLLINILNDKKDLNCLERAVGRYGRSVVECSVDGESLGSKLAQSGWHWIIRNTVKANLKEKKTKQNKIKMVLGQGVLQHHGIIAENVT